jgi:hypothetical protein
MATRADFLLCSTLMSFARTRSFYALSTFIDWFPPMRPLKKISAIQQAICDNSTWRLMCLNTFEDMG